MARMKPVAARLFRIESVIVHDRKQNKPPRIRKGLGILAPMMLGALLGLVCAAFACSFNLFLLSFGAPLGLAVGVLGSLILYYGGATLRMWDFVLCYGPCLVLAMILPMLIGMNVVIIPVLLVTVFCFLIVLRGYRHKLFTPLGRGR